MAERPQEPENSGPAGAPKWMVTFADAMSLLLTFFVLLLTFSTTREEDSKKASGGMAGTLGPLLDAAGDTPPSIVQNRIAMAGRATARGAETPPEFGASPMTMMNLNVRIRKEGLGTAITVSSGRKGFVLRLPNDEIFAGPGSKVLSPVGRKRLGKIAKVIQYLPNDIEIAAHTDGDGGEKDLDLSTARAVRVARFFETYDPATGPGGGINSERIGVRAHGGLQPIAAGETAIDRERNQRLEVTLLRYTH